jgi:hypothetical protein
MRQETVTGIKKLRPVRMSPALFRIVALRDSLLPRCLFCPIRKHKTRVSFRKSPTLSHMMRFSAPLPSRQMSIRSDRGGFYPLSEVPMVGERRKIRTLLPQDGSATNADSDNSNAKRIRLEPFAWDPSEILSWLWGGLGDWIAEKWPGLIGSALGLLPVMVILALAMSSQEA